MKEIVIVVTMLCVVFTMVPREIEDERPSIKLVENEVMVRTDRGLTRINMNGIAMRCGEERRMNNGNGTMRDCVEP